MRNRLFTILIVMAITISIGGCAAPTPTTIPTRSSDSYATVEERAQHAAPGDWQAIRDDPKAYRGQDMFILGKFGSAHQYETTVELFVSDENGHTWIIVADKSVMSWDAVIKMSSPRNYYYGVCKAQNGQNPELDIYYYSTNPA